MLINRQQSHVRDSKISRNATWVLFKEARFPINKDIGLFYLSSTSYREARKMFYQYHPVQKRINMYILKCQKLKTGKRKRKEKTTVICNTPRNEKRVLRVWLATGPRQFHPPLPRDTHYLARLRSA